MKLINLVLTALTLFFHFNVSAQTYPSRPITLVVPFAPGSGTDHAAHVIAGKLGDRLKQPVVVDNKPGASAQIGAEFVAAAKPDGYTLFMTTNTSHSANPNLFKKLHYDPIKDFTPITMVGEPAFAVVVNPALPVKTLQDFINFAKANPGKTAYGTPNSTSLVASETIKRLAGIDTARIPYKASPQALTDLVSGQIQFYVVDFASGMGMMQSGRVRTLAVTGREESPLLPGVPPVAATLPGFDVTAWNGIFGPAGLPKPVVEKLHAEIVAVLADKEVKEKLAGLGFLITPSKSPQEFEKYVSTQLKHWENLVRQAGIRPE